MLAVNAVESDYGNGRGAENSGKKRQQRRTHSMVVNDIRLGKDSVPGGQENMGNGIKMLRAQRKELSGAHPLNVFLFFFLGIRPNIDRSVETGLGRSYGQLPDMGFYSSDYILDSFLPNIGYFKLIIHIILLNCYLKRNLSRVIKKCQPPEGAISQPP